PTTPAHVGPLEFSVIGDAQKAYAAYGAYAAALAAFIEGGAKECEGFATALLGTVKIYQTAHDASKADVDALNKALAALT
ncbi:MAG: hypothetical protein ABI400_04960, partial [Lacisediminihabitans sp.]